MVTLSRMDLAEMPCPNCGYDLRAATMDRCSECGMEIDRALLKESRIPWVYRKRLGRMRAYLATVWRITIDSRQLRHELSRPQSPRDSRWFRWTTGALLGLLMGAIAGAAIGVAGTESLVVLPGNPWFGPPVRFAWAQDAVVPWSAGVAIPPVLPLSLVVLGFAMARVPRTLLRNGRLKNYGGEHQRRALAMGDYLCAPLLIVAGALAVGAGLVFIGVWLSKSGRIDGQFGVMLAAGAPQIVIVLALLAMFWRAGQWTARATRKGLLMALWGMAELLGLCLLAIAMCAGFIPWAAGFFWIVIDSYRA